MERRTLESVGVALLSALALALAAATVSSPVERRGGGSGSGGGVSTVQRPLGELPGYGPVGVFLGAVVALVLASLFLYLLYYGVRHYPIRTLAVLAVTAVFVAVAVLAAKTGGPVQGLDRPHLPIDTGRLDESDRSGAGSTTPVPTGLVVLVVGLAAATTVFVWRRARPDGTDGGTETENTATPESVARAAGDAADRIESGESVENGVYRAWREMTELLSVSSSGTRTPGEFADAAVEAGMDPDDVAELTRLFEDVRYGTDDPTPGTERRAREVFRRIEDRYGERS